MYSLNHIVQQTGVSRHLLMKHAKALGIYPEVKNQGQRKIYFYSTEDTKTILNYLLEFDTESNQLKKELVEARREIERLRFERDELRYELKKTLTQLNNLLFTINKTAQETMQDETSNKTTYVTFPSAKCDRSGYTDGIALIRKKIGMVDS